MTDALSLSISPSNPTASRSLPSQLKNTQRPTRFSDMSRCAPNFGWPALAVSRFVTTFPLCAFASQMQKSEPAIAASS
jgi:hypothetical protein